MEDTIREFRKNPMTWLIIGVNVVIFLLVEFTGGSEDIDHMLRWGASMGSLIEQGEYYRLFTCMFLHFGLAHLGSNMLLLYFIGGHLERATGKIRFLLLYLLGGVSASAVSCYLELKQGETVVSAGASGAVFAVLGALLWVLLRNRGHLEELTIGNVVIMAALALYQGFTDTGVDNAAHVGGFAAGFVLCILFYHRKRQG